VLREESHASVAVFKPDLSISLAWGLPSNSDFKEPWANGFADPKASSAFLDLFWMGTLVHRTTYVHVDGGRGNLPLPSPSGDELTVERDYSALIRLVDSLDHVSQYDLFFKRAGFSEVETPWPRGRM
jgi:hypothetical protein